MSSLSIPRSKIPALRLQKTLIREDAQVPYTKDQYLHSPHTTPSMLLRLRLRPIPDGQINNKGHKWVTKMSTSGFFLKLLSRDKGLKAWWNPPYPGPHASDLFDKFKFKVGTRPCLPQNYGSVKCLILFKLTNPKLGKEGPHKDPNCGGGTKPYLPIPPPQPGVQNPSSESLRLCACCVCVFPYL